MRESKFTGYQLVTTGYHFIQKEINPMKYSALDVLLSLDSLDVRDDTGTDQHATAAGIEHRGVKLINSFGSV